jgi:hypothetical protein
MVCRPTHSGQKTTVEICWAAVNLQSRTIESLQSSWGSADRRREGGGLPREKEGRIAKSTKVDFDLLASWQGAYRWENQTLPSSPL